MALISKQTYKLIGEDKQVYGPVTLEQLRQWQAEGRVDSETQVQIEGSEEWKPLASLPGFGIPPPVYMTPAARQTRGGMAITGFIFGILSNICFSLYVFPALGIIFSGIALMRPENGRKGLATAGLVLSLIGLVWHRFVPVVWFYRWHRW